MNDHNHTIYGPCQQCHKYHTGPCPSEFELRPYKMPKPARGAICWCGHYHASGDDGEDAGCETCGCLKWKYPETKTYPQMQSNDAAEWLRKEYGRNAFGFENIQQMAERILQRYGDFREESIRGMLKISEEDVVNLKEIIEECATENKALRALMPEGKA